MAKKPIQKIGVVANLLKPDMRTLLSEFVPSLLTEQIEVFLDKETADFLKWDPAQVRVGINEDCDMITVLGGDGTILNVARQYSDMDIPILGVNVGRLGFLAPGKPKENIHWIKQGRYQIQERMRISARIMEDGKEIEHFTALNDIVVHGAGFSRMVNLRTEVDGKLLREYAADGVILATPTGSTAYSLSAGGPLIMPTLEAMVVAPLCSHSLNIRPIVLEAGQTVRIEVISHKSKVNVTVDGQVGSELDKGQHVEIQKSARSTKLVVPEDYDFFTLLREKL